MRSELSFLGIFQNFLKSAWQKNPVLIMPENGTRLERYFWQAGETVFADLLNSYQALSCYVNSNVSFCLAVSSLRNDFLQLTNELFSFFTKFFIK